MWELYSKSFKTKSRLLLQAKSVEPSTKLQTLQLRRKNKSFKEILSSIIPKTDPYGAT